MSSDRDERGYRVTPGAGPVVRADVVDVYIARIARPERISRNDDMPDDTLPAEIEYLQLQRSKDPLKGSWQPVMGHIEAGETAVQAAEREAMEEAGLAVHSADCLGFWALEQVSPFYIAAIDCIVLSPRFLAVVRPGWGAKLNAEHAAARWVATHEAERSFCWPGQHAAVREAEAIMRGRSAGAVWTRIV